MLAVAVSAAAFVMSGMLLQQVLEYGTIVYELGGWRPPWGIEYRIDELNAYVLLIVSALGTVVMFSARKSVESEIAAERRIFFYVAYLLCLSGLLGIVATADLFNVFVFLEMSALSSYILIALGHDRRGLWASFQYLMMGTVGATFILIGIGLIYAKTGTLNMQDISDRLPAVSDTRTVFTGFVFLVVGVCLKLALFPVHLWLPNAYAYAPSSVTAFLAATATKVAVYLLIRLTFSIFGVEFSFSSFPLQQIFLVLSLAGILIASTTAIFQENVKRLLAYSSVAQIGYMILGFSLASVTGLTASLLHLFNHALMKGALFLALGAVMYRIGSVRLDDLAGLGKSMPLTMGAVVIGGLSLIGVPLTVGFISKWYLITAALEREWWGVAVLVLVGSMLAVVYIWRIVEAAYFRTRAADAAPVAEAPASLLIPTWILVVANVYFGIDTRLTVGVSESIASILFGVAP
ncbi:MAG: monovalent cation/H+ antiporter subunit D family protein [Pseudomonadales bacterium]|nr:monovalent cation/H+ antiporter subunit D family protein [Pseudomonadales bacterium]